MGQDSDGNPVELACAATKVPQPFGTVVKKALVLGEHQLGLHETPTLAVDQLGNGVAVSFVANAGLKTQESLVVGTLKLSALYLPGVTISCVNHTAGGRATFQRLVAGLWKSLKLRQDKAAPAVFALGQRWRRGDRTIGFSFDSIRRKKKDGSFAELHTVFYLRSNEKSWEVFDSVRIVERSNSGIISKYTRLIWPNGRGPLELIAKPSEGGKLRIKSKVGAASDAIELTPQVPLGTELWEAAALRRVATGAESQHGYSMPSVDDDDPSLNYVTLTQARDGVVQESIRRHGKTGENTAAADPDDQLFIDGRGLVKKQVGAEVVIELIHTWGSLPTVVHKAGAS